MFYEGDLQSGIGKAVQESKLVACFVTDEGEESQVWENEFLTDESLIPLLADQTVLLRLKAGSQEAGYLAAIFPLPKNPTLVIIRNGELKEYLVAGVSKEDFMRRLRLALGSGAQSAPTPATTQPSSTTPQARTSTPTAQQTIASSSTPTAQPSTAVQDLLAERSARLEAQKKEQDAKEKAKRAAEAKARREAAESAEAPDSKPAADMKYALMQKKRQQDARDERARILKRVEDDRAERREKEAARKAQAKALLEGHGQSSEAGPSTMKQAASTNSKECAIQIRLFDGSTIRSRFPSSGSLRKDVRPWIDQKQEGDVPYTFKQVLSPLPNKNIETSEEERSLQSLGLSPSATLILLPVTGYTSAYDGNGGYVSTAVSAGYGLVSSGVGMVTGILGSLLGGGAPASAPAEERHDGARPSIAPGPSINVRTLRDQQDKRDDQQFYNGNALNFEPRKDDDEKKED